MGDAYKKGREKWLREAKIVRRLKEEPKVAEKVTEVKLEELGNLSDRIEKLQKKLAQEDRKMLKKGTKIYIKRYDAGMREDYANQIRYARLHQYYKRREFFYDEGKEYTFLFRMYKKEDIITWIKNGGKCSTQMLKTFLEEAYFSRKGGSNIAINVFASQLMERENETLTTQQVTARLIESEKKGDIANQIRYTVVLQNRQKQEDKENSILIPDNPYIKELSDSFVTGQFTKQDIPYLAEDLSTLQEKEQAIGCVILAAHCIEEGEIETAVSLIKDIYQQGKSSNYNQRIRGMIDGLAAYRDRMNEKKEREIEE